MSVNVVFNLIFRDFSSKSTYQSKMWRGNGRGKEGKRTESNSKQKKK